MRPGRGFHQFWFVSAAWSLVRTRLNPDLAQVLKQRAPDKLSKLYYKVLAALEDLPDSHSLEKVYYLWIPNWILLNQAQATMSTNSLSNRLTRATDPKDPMLYPLAIADDHPIYTEPDQFHFGDFAEWTLDDLWSFDFSTNG